MIRMTAALLFGLLIVAPVLASGDNDQPAPKDKSDEKEEVLSFSNEDLERKYGGGEEKGTAKRVPSQPAAEKKPAAGEESALDKMFAKEAARKESASKVAESEAAVAAAKERVARLQKTKLAIANPYLARPAPPEDEAEAARWKEQGASERLNSTDAELAAARKALAEAEAALAKARGN